MPLVVPLIELLIISQATLQVPSLRLKVPSLRDIFSLFTYGNPDGVITRGQLLTFVRQMGGVESILDAFIVETEDKIRYDTGSRVFAADGTLVLKPLEVDY